MTRLCNRSEFEDGMVEEQSSDQVMTNGTDAGSGTPEPASPRRSSFSGPSPQPSVAEGGESTAPTDTTGGPTASVAADDHVELVEQGARDVTVGSLSIQQGGVTNAWADSIEVRQGGITRAEGRDISVIQGGIVVARADRVSVGMGAIGLAVGGEVEVNRGFARSVVARDVRIEQGGARTVIASKAVFDRSSGALVVIAAKAEGNVRTLLDWRGALALGAAFGLVAGLARRVRR